MAGVNRPPYNKGGSKKSIGGKAPVKNAKPIFYTKALIQKRVGLSALPPSFKQKSAELSEKLSANHQVQRASISEFKFVSLLGSGAFGSVISVTHNSQPGVLMAMKVQQKKHIIKKKQVPHVLSEKHILSCTDFVFIPKLFFSFKDNANLFMVMELVPGGDFFELIESKGKLTEDQTKFYVSQVIMAFDYLHGANVVFRDLKPENLLVDTNGYLKVTDFGFAKVVAIRTYTLCGTPEYFAPELLCHKPYNRSSDWWTVGILTFELLCGFTPFYDPEVTKIYFKIVNEPLKFPTSTPLSGNCQDFMSNLLQTDVTRRLGCTSGGPARIYEHKWFTNFYWMTVLSRQQAAPFLPNTRNHGAAKAVDPRIIEVCPVDSYPNEFSKF